MSSLSSQESVLLLMHLVPRTFLGKEQVLKTYLWKMMVASMILVVVVRMMLVGMW